MTENNYKLASLIKKLNSYNLLASQIDSINKQCQNLRKQRSLLETEIVSDINGLSLHSKKLKIGDSSYYLAQQKEKPNLTLELIKHIAKDSLGSERGDKFVSDLNTYRDENKKVTLCLKMKNKKPSSRSIKRKLVEDLKQKTNNHHSLKKKV